MTLSGFDVSHHQGVVDFTKAKASGQAFVVIKATEGTGYTDPSLAGYRQTAHAAGLAVGLYHYAGSSTARTVYAPDVEAAYFIKQVGPLAPGEFVVLDFEPAVPPSFPVQWAKTWLDTVTAALGPRPLIYMNQTVRDRYDWSPIAADYGLWLARYDGSTVAPPSGNWGSAAMKQYSDAGTVPGVVGGCDVNVFYGSAAALAAYGAQSQEDDMPFTEQQIRDLTYESMKNLFYDMAMGNNKVAADSFVGLVALKTAPLQAQIAGLSDALKQLAAAPGQTVDLTAVTAAAKAGAEAALAEAVNVNVNVGGKPTGS